jgi:F-type H+-transporting ATPase subunit b
MFEFEPGLMIWTTVSFGLLVLLLYKMALPPILAFLATREKQIADALAESEASRKEAAELLAEQKKQLAEINRKAEQIVAEAKTEGRKTMDEIVQQANQEAKRLVDKGEAELEQKKTELLAEARQEIANLVVEVSSKIIKRRLTAADDQRLITEALQNERN